MAAKGLTLSQTDFPLYAIRVIGDRHFLVAGGGGSAKTGIPNAVDFFELKRENKAIAARKVTHYEIESKAVMNCDVFRQDKHFILAAGQEDSCHLYTMHYKVITPKVENEALEGLRKRKGNLTISNDHRNASKMIGFEIEPGEAVKTDKAKDDGFQKVVRFTHDASKIVTGGADGHFRVWKVPQLKRVHEVKAHADEVDDLDVSPDDSQIVTVSRDNHGYIWNAKDGKKVGELEWKQSVEYRFRNCRYGVVSDKPGEFCLYTTTIPAKRNSKRQDSSFVIRWDPLKAAVTKTVNAGSEILSALAVSDDGKYVAVGTISGSVSVYISFSLQEKMGELTLFNVCAVLQTLGDQFLADRHPFFDDARIEKLKIGSDPERLYHLSAAHSIFVTGLEFASSETPQSVVGPNVDFTLFSISCDNLVKVHQQESRSLYSPLWAIVGFILLLFLLYWLITALDS